MGPGMCLDSLTIETYGSGYVFGWSHNRDLWDQVCAWVVSQ